MRVKEAAIRVGMIAILILQPTLCVPAEGLQDTAETKAVRALADRFTERVEESLDVSALYEEFFIPDFAERYVRDQLDSAEEKGNQRDEVMFISGLLYSKRLHTEAKPEDWRRFSFAAWNFFFITMVSGLNSIADDVLKGADPDPDKFLKSIPPAVVGHFEGHPILKNLIQKKDANRAILNAAEMRDVTAMLEQGAKLWKEAKGDSNIRFSPQSRQVIEMMRQEGMLSVTKMVSSRKFFGYPEKTRYYLVRTSFGLSLIVIGANEGFKVAWIASVGY
ncbi:MAG: hypothetical protein AB7H86_05700 [Blastocatellales bacterium]